MAEEHANATAFGLDSMHEEIKYLIFHSSLCYSVETKRGDEFRHSARNASRIQRKVGNGVS